MRYEVISVIPYKVIAKCDKLKTCKAIIEDEETQDLIDKKKNFYKIYDFKKDRFLKWK